VRFFDENRIGKGDRVIIWAQNRMEWVAVFWACVARGVELVPVDFRFSVDLVARIRNESNPKLMIDDAMLEEIARWPTGGFVPSAVSADDVVEIVYTSGTTGEPKGVVHRHRNLCANLEPFRAEIAKYKKWARFFQPIRILDLLPLSHMFGQSLGLFMPLFLEGAVAFTSEIHPGKIIQFVRENRISVLVCVPRILENLKNDLKRGTRGQTPRPLSGCPPGASSGFPAGAQPSALRRLGKRSSRKSSGRVQKHRAEAAVPDQLLPLSKGSGARMAGHAVRRR
jgi:long-chain acyl-CoA synthetase